MNQDLLVNKYEKKGYVVIKNFLSKKEINTCVNSLKNYSLKFKRKNKRDINFTKDGKINSIHNLEKWIWTKKLRLKFPKKLLERLINGKAKNFGSEYFAKPPKSGLSSPIHQDNYYWCVNNGKGITIWVALDKADSRNGGVFYYESSHKLGLLKHKPSFAPGSSQTIKNKSKLKKLKMITPKLKSGDCIVHNAMIVHGSNKNFSTNSRRGITVRYIAKYSKIIKVLKENYEKNLIKQNSKYI
jgi:phytanoyl-CoA hydroxylase|tara:strand:- start:89 stop:814 length:726 start_codon:yes stop_codon:yes gene_type:complete